MREANVWTWFDQTRPSWLAAERVEVYHPAGMSDVLWTDTRRSPAISGWLELKFCEENHADFRRGRIPYLKPRQALFLRRQAQNNVPCGILLQVGKSWYHVWRASPDRDWVNTIQSVRSFDIITESWELRPEPEQIVRALGLPLPL